MFTIATTVPQIVIDYRSADADKNKIVQETQKRWNLELFEDWKG